MRSVISHWYSHVLFSTVQFGKTTALSLGLTFCCFVSSVNCQPWLYIFRRQSKHIHGWTQGGIPEKKDKNKHFRQDISMSSRQSSWAHAHVETHTHYKHITIHLPEQFSSMAYMIIHADSIPQDTGTWNKKEGPFKLLSTRKTEKNKSSQFWSS